MSSALVPNGNICLTFDELVSQKFLKYSAKYFSDLADGYRLGWDSLPHITLCQFHHDKPQPRALRRELSEIVATPEAIDLDNLEKRPGTGIHEGYNWFAFSLLPAAPWLIDLQTQVETILRKYDMTVLTPSGPDYHPQATICRAKADSKPPVDDAFKNKLFIEPSRINLSLGQSDVNSQCQKIFWTRKLA